MAEMRFRLDFLLEDHDGSRFWRSWTEAPFSELRSSDGTFDKFGVEPAP